MVCIQDHSKSFLPVSRLSFIFKIFFSVMKKVPVLVLVQSSRITKILYELLSCNSSKKGGNNF